MELGGIGIGIDKMELTPCLILNAYYIFYTLRIV